MIKQPKPAVLHIITKLDLGGAQKSCLALIQELQTQHPNYEIYLISGITGPLVPQAQTLKNVYLLPSLIWEVKLQNIFLELQNFYHIWQIMRQLKQKHPQLIVHTHTIKAGTIGRFAGLLAGVKTRIHTIHGYAFHPYQNKLVWLSFYLIELINSLITTHFICVSQSDLEAGCELFPNFKLKSSLIRAATTGPVQPLRPVKSTGFTIGTIANLKPGKNLFELLRAFKLAQKSYPNLKLEIIGDGPLGPAITEQIKKLNLTEQVKLLGWVPNPQIYLQNWQTFVFTSLWEGLPCAVVEARALNLPILAYQVGGIPDLILPEQLYPIGSWSKLADGIKKHYLQIPKLHPPTLLPEFYTAKMALDHINLYKELSL